MADCLQLFSAAISAPPSSPTQRTELARLKHHFQASPAVLPILYPSLLALIAQPGSSPYLTKWVSTIIELAICRPLAPPDQKLQLVLQSTETIHKLLTLQDSSHLETKKNAIQAAATSYPLIFKHALSKPTPDPRQWGFASQTKSIILSLWRSESSPLGLRIAAIKYVQRIVQVGTRGAADPRKRGDDPSIAMCAATPHAFLRPKELEAESNTLLEETVRMLFQTKSPEVASAIIIATGTLVRLRPALAPLIISTLSSYVPTTSPLVAQPTQLKGVEKTLRITLSHLDRATPTPAVREALIAQVKRIDEINERETDRKRQRREEDMVAKKRMKIQQQHQIDDHVEGGDSLAVAPNQVDQQLPGFDVTSLPVDLVVELVMANLLVLTEQTLHDALANFCRTLPSDSCIPVANQPAPVARPTTPNKPTPTLPVVNTGSPVRPKMELILPTSQPFVDVKLDPDEVAAPKSVFLDNWEPERPLPLTESSRRILLRMTLDRIVAGSESASGEGVWATLLARLVARGMQGYEEEIEARREDVRRALFSFIVSDFPKRIHFARVWLMEEWLASRRLEHVQQGEPAYDRWLSVILDHLLSLASNSTPPTAPAADTASSSRHVLSNFLLDLPHLPDQEMVRLGQLCQDPAKLTIGFTTLRELTCLRPTIRFRTLDVLLALSTHPRRQTRNAAILCVKSWVASAPSHVALGERVVSFAIQLAQKLVMDSQEAERPIVQREDLEDGETAGDDDDEDGLEAGLAKVENAVLVSGLGRPKEEPLVVQHLELLLAVSVKNPDLLDQLYPDMSNEVQDSVQKLITPLIRTLGPKHSKLISLVQTCPKGAEPLILRILSILTEKGGKAPIGILEAIKNLPPDRSPRLLVATIPDMTKPEIITYLPRILGLLSGTLQERAEVRTVFEAIVVQPLGTSNVPRTCTQNLLTPVELLVLLHQTDGSNSLSIRQAIDAIGLCFSITEIFKPETLAAFMQQVVDETNLPTLFLRTVIQAVQTYKSLQAFVSTTLLSRLILKKIWNQAQLWEGFMRCSKIIAPHSFGALLQLPKEQLKELVGKQPGLKGPLRDYVVKKAGNNKGRVGALLEILSDQQPQQQQQIQSTDASAADGSGAGGVVAGDEDTKGNDAEVDIEEDRIVEGDLEDVALQSVRVAQEDILSVANENLLGSNENKDTMMLEDKQDESKEDESKKKGREDAVMSKEEEALSKGEELVVGLQEKAKIDVADSEEELGRKRLEEGNDVVINLNLLDGSGQQFVEGNEHHSDDQDRLVKNEQGNVDNPDVVMRQEEAKGTENEGEQYQSLTTNTTATTQDSSQLVQAAVVC